VLERDRVVSTVKCYVDTGVVVDTLLWSSVLVFDLSGDTFGVVSECMLGVLHKSSEAVGQFSCVLRPLPSRHHPSVFAVASAARC
jgi:hypothetical protein